MISPASSQIAAKFGITDDVLEVMITSIFVLGKRFAFGRTEPSLPNVTPLQHTPSGLFSLDQPPSSGAEPSFSSSRILSTSVRSIYIHTMTGAD